MQKISVKGRQFVNEDGEPIVFKGINAVYKGETVSGQDRKNYIPDWTEKTFDTFASWGFNLLRFGLIWDAVEHRPGEYDDEYLDKMGEFIGMCEERGIYVFLDMHQDCYAAATSDGAPDWACITDSYKFRKPKFIWAEGYWLDKAVWRCFDNFWNNAPVLGKGLQDYYADMWVHVAERLSRYSNIIGYDIMNEPCPGTDGGRIVRGILKSGIKTILSNKVKKIPALKNIIHGDSYIGALTVFNDPLVFGAAVSGGEKYSEHFDKEVYYPFLKKVAQRLRDAGADGIIFAENNYYCNTGIPCHIPRLVYDDGTVEQNFAFTPHGYDMTVDTKYTNTASPERVDFIFSRHLATQNRLDCPVIVGEWGGMVGGADDYPALNHLLEVFKRNGWSNTYWCYYGGIEDTKIPGILSEA